MTPGRRRLSACGAFACAAALVTLGCGPAYQIGAIEKAAGAERVLQVIEQRLDDERADTAGASRWAQPARAEYQNDGDISRIRGMNRIEETRVADASALVAAGPLTLESCLSFALGHNDSLQASRAALIAEAGEASIKRSRFLPQLAYTFDSERVHEDGIGSMGSQDSFLRLGQTIAEFGRDSDVDVTLRASARAALFAFEDAVASTLSEARKRFFTILLRRQQIDERRKLLAEFRDRYEKMHQLEEARRVLEVDVLTARLNVLNEEARINSLERELLRQKYDLLNLMGFPVGMTEAELAGEIEDFGVPQDEAVRIGLRRSTSIAQMRADVAEQARVAREVKMRYGADLTARAGVKSDTTAAGLALSDSDGLYSLSAFAEQHLQDEVDAWNTSDTTLDAQEPGWSADVRLTIPIFDGLARRGEYLKQRARLAQAIYSLRESIASVEVDIRKAFHTVLERRKDLEILAETVRISKERLRVQERYKELGRITDNELETFRNRFFSDQDTYFSKQISLMEAQEYLRYAMRFFEPIKQKGSTSGDARE